MDARILPDNSKCDIYSSTALRRISAQIPARLVLYFLSWSGFLVSFMMRTDINIALVAMVKIPPPSLENTTNSSEPMPELYCYRVTNHTQDNNNSTSVVTNFEEGEFDWSTATQSAVIGSFYWWYIISQIVGGVATQRFGTKNVFGWSQFFTALSSLLIPIGASMHPNILIGLRSVQGFASGLTWPAMYAAVGHWIPLSERSKFMSSFQGFSFGIGLTYAICGFIISHWGWRGVFYTSGTIGMLWCVLWYFLAFDNPSKHPRISPSELSYIKSNLGYSVVAGEKGMPVPWMSIFKSWPAWSIGLTTFGRIWVHYTFMVSGPMYMKTVLGFSIQTNGLLSGAPFLCSYVASVFFCYIADLLVTKRLMTLTNVRKLFTALAQVAPGVLVLLIGFLGCDIVLVLIIWFIAVTLITASYAGAMASIVDIAPNLAGPVLAFAQTIHMTASFLSPIVNGYLTRESQNLETWRHVFYVTSVIAICTYIFFQIFGTADIQPWNYPNCKVPSTKECETILNPATEEEASKDEKKIIDAV
ncbi:sialin-like [Ctenocephalides felis]|uniref:sialin-like n=1 Tax=Ctenocephalides felis TaxID=7515 RepID=UPI000E6E58CA|nr:sialin-like [Ctenocephalides felis]